LFLCTVKTKKQLKMVASFVIAVALAAAVIVVVLTPVAVIVYQRWRINDNNAHLKQFIDENMELRERLCQADVA
jgi:hypothetical protein